MNSILSPCEQKLAYVTIIMIFTWLSLSSITVFFLILYRLFLKCLYINHFFIYIYKIIYLSFFSKKDYARSQMVVFNERYRALITSSTIVEQLRNMCNRMQESCRSVHSPGVTSREVEVPGNERARAGEKGYQVVQESLRGSNPLHASAQPGRSGFAKFLAKRSMRLSASMTDILFRSDLPSRHPILTALSIVE